MIKLSYSLLVLFSFCLISQTAIASDSFDHGYTQWGSFLKQYVRDGKVNYKNIQKFPQVFQSIVQSLEKVSAKEYVAWSDPQKKAFWINAYNIQAIKLVLDHYPLKRSLGLQAIRYPANSIQQIPDVWNQEVMTILGKRVSLNYIENEILRKEFKDPRVHFAIVCASLGCPVLRGAPYTFDQLDIQWNDQVEKFVQNPKKANYDSRSNTLYVSPIFKWFRDDFEKVGGIIVFVRKYMPSSVKLSDDAKIQWLDYDWSLNEQKLK